MWWSVTVVVTILNAEFTRFRYKHCLVRSRNVNLDYWFEMWNKQLVLCLSPIHPPRPLPYAVHINYVNWIIFGHHRSLMLSRTIFIFWSTSSWSLTSSNALIWKRWQLRVATVNNVIMFEAGVIYILKIKTHKHMSMQIHTATPTQTNCNYNFIVGLDKRFWMFLTPFRSNDVMMLKQCPAAHSLN